MTKSQRSFESFIVAALVTLAGITLVYVFMKMGLPKKAPAPSVSNPPAATVTSETVPAGQTAQISLTDQGFVPQKVTVTAGTTIVWTNNSGIAATVNSADHPTHLRYPMLNLGEFQPGATLTVTLGNPGSYSYHNHYMPSQYGTITVQ